MTGEQLNANLVTAVRRLSDGIQTLPVKKIQQVISVLMIVWILAEAAQLVGVFIPESIPAAQPVSTPSTDSDPQAANALDLEALQSMNLFGEGASVAATEQPEPEVSDDAIDAEKTSLNLMLEGIVFSSNVKESVAVIVHQGRQETYYVGDDIPVGNKVSLVQVLLDRVILSNNGKYEALWLYDDSKPSNSSSRAQPTARADRPDRVNDMRANSSITAMAENYRDRVLTKPASLAEVIRITPAKHDGAMVGYRISPGKDSEQFAQLGLQPNDIVTSINSIDLNEPSNALEVYKLMRTATQATFVIDRNGETIEVQVALGSP